MSVESIQCGAVRVPILLTRFPELGFANVDKGRWRIIDRSTGSTVGPHYRTKAELMADVDRFAELFGCR